jgi:excisionase family DNA binding protein
MFRSYKTASRRPNTVHVSETWSNQTLLTLGQAAQYVICTPRYLQKQIRAGRLRALKPTGKLVRIRRSDLEKFLESGATAQLFRLRSVNRYCSSDSIL